MKKLVERFAVACAAFLFVCSSDASGAGPEDGDKSKAPPVCETSLVGSTIVNDDFMLALETHDFAELVQPTTTANLAVAHPGILMSAAQRAYLQIIQKKPVEVVDPLYRVGKVHIYPLFSEGGPESGGAGIVGQYDAVHALVNYIRGNDRTKNKGALLLVGGPGTGKSATTEVLANARAYYATNDPRFSEYSFVWKGLNSVPSLAGLGNAAGEFPSQLGLSPFVLLPEAVQDRLVAMATPSFRAQFGEDPRPPRYRDPQTDEIFRAIIQHRFSGRAPTEAEIVALLNDHVRVVRRVFRAKDLTGVIGYQGDEPKLELLFGSEDLVRAATFGKGHPLSMNFLGLVARGNGGVLMFDEYFRNVPPLVNALLGLSQGGRLDFGFQPVTMDVVPVFATNDKSIELAEARESQGAAKNRTLQVAMRGVLHPALVGKIALITRGASNFEMRPLEGGSSPWIPANMRLLYPDPTPEGILEGPEGRYSIAALTPNGKRVVIAPHALTMLSYTAAATRFVTDPGRLLPYPQLDVLTNQPVFLNAVQRLEALTGRTNPEAAIRSELRTLSYLLQEGEGGVTARDVDRWLSIALEMAEESGGSLTPVTMNAAFEALLTKHAAAPNQQVFAQWIARHQAVKEAFILPALARDITSILGGDRGRASSLYDVIRKVIVARTTNPEATEYVAESGERVKINDKQLKDLQVVYHREIGRELVFAGISNFHLAHEGKRDPDLMRAIERYILDTVIDTNTLTDLINVLTGKTVGSQEVAALAKGATDSLEQHGYDRQSFLEAVRFVRDLKAERDLRENQK